ncbi:MAG: molybdopterin-binding protein [Burkholderiaceae bacterium]
MRRFGVVIVGDEILSGRRADKHLSKVISLLTARGLELSWAQYVGDDRDAIAAVLARTFASDDVVFVTGGIGATPDDQTRQAAAQARGVDVLPHPEAERLIRERIEQMNAESANPLPLDSPEHRQRLRMGEFPAGASIIPNPYNRIPGFSIGEHYFVPGFPVMAWPMLEWVLETRYADQFHHAPRGERSVLVFDMPESRITPLMEQIESAFDDVRVFSLPSVGDAAAVGNVDPQVALKAERHIELGVKGPAERIAAAFAALEAGLAALGARFVRVEAA